MKKLLLLLAMILLPMVASADAVEIDGIYYNLIEKAGQAEVTQNPNKYTGEVVIPESVTYEGKNYSVTSIGDRAFLNCSGMTSVTIPNSVTSIGDGAFSECSQLPSITIPNGVTSIGKGAFAWCNGLTSVTIANSVTSIGDRAFLNCSGMTSVTIPNSVTSIGDGAFSGCSQLPSITIPNGVTSIGFEAFAGCSRLTSVSIPNGVTSIGKSAFHYCSGMTSVTIPSSVTSIGFEAFAGCSGLTSVHITDLASWCKIEFFDNSNPLSYAQHLYMNGEEIKNLIIPNSVTSIGNRAFICCSNLTSVTIPNSVTSIGEFAFAYCSGLPSITIPNSVTSIGSWAFYKCSGLTSVTIPNSVTTIGEAAFYKCSGLTSVTIPSSLTNIGAAIFRGCSGLTSVTIPNSVTSIGNEAFAGCSDLTSVTIPSSVTTIGEYAFSGCSSLTMLSLPEEIQIIKRGTFYGCGIQSIIIPAKVEYIYQEAFRCNGTQEVKVLASTPPFAYDNTFSNYDIPLYVPSGSTDTYQSTNPWSKFSSLKTLSGEDVEVKVCAKPTISYNNGKLNFNCETEEVTYQYTITDSDVKSGSGNEVQLGVTYNISVYATKDGYENSETATATLCWIDQKPTTEGITDGIANVPARALLIKNNGGQLTVEGAADGEAISVYTVNAVQSGSAISQNGAASIDTNLKAGSIAIVKIGDKSVKVVIK